MKRGSILILLLCLVLLAAGCGKKEPKVVIGGGGTELLATASGDAAGENGEMPDLFIYKGEVEDMSLMVFEKVKGAAREFVYYYNGGTEIFDRFSQPMSREQMQPGEIYELDIDVNTQTIERMEQSRHVWVFPELHKYAVDLKKGSLTVGSEVYRLDETVPVFDNDEQFTREQIGESDELTIIGDGKEIFSVLITTSHGEIEFTNIAGFEKGYFVLGNVAAARITKNAPMSVRAGTYLLEVAGSGHSGAKEVTIEPGEKTVVDLKEFNTGTTKKGKLILLAKQKDVSVTLNGKKIKLGKAMTLPYGIYRVKATKDGYSDWSKILFFNSRNARIEINLADKSGKNANANNTKPTSGLAGSVAGTVAGSQTGSGSTTGNNSTTGTTGTTGTSGTTGNTGSTGSSSSSSIGSLANEVLKILTENKTDDTTQDNEETNTGEMKETRN